MHFIDDRTRLSLIPSQSKQHRKFFSVLFGKIFSHVDVTSVRTIADADELRFVWRITSNIKEPFVRLSRLRPGLITYNTASFFFFLISDPVAIPTNRVPQSDRA